MPTHIKPETTAVNHGAFWTVFLPYMAGIDVFDRDGFLICEEHSLSACRHVRAVEKAIAEEAD